MSKETQLTVVEVETILHVMNQRISGKIKDVRVLSNLRKLLTSKLPAKPIEPTPLGEKPNEEEVKKFQAISEEYVKQVKLYQETVLGFNFDSLQLFVLKERLAKFDGFFTDEFSSSGIIALGDKFGV